MVKRRYAPDGSAASSYARNLAAQAEHHTSILQRERALRRSHQGELGIHTNETQLPDVKKDRPCSRSENQDEQPFQRQSSMGNNFSVAPQKLTGFLPKIVQDASDPPPPEASTKSDNALQRPTTAEPNPNPPDPKKRDIYMGSTAVQSAIEGEPDGSTSATSSTFMSAMAELRPGLSDDQRRRVKEQKEMLRNQLEQQVIERKEREAREKAERKAREEREEAEIRAYHQKLKEREEQERLRRLEAAKANEINPTAPMKAHSMGRDPPIAIRHHQIAVAHDRDERVIGVAGSLPVKQPRHETLTAYQAPEPAPEMLGRSTVENRRLSPSSSVASSIRSMERDPISGKPVMRLSGGYTFDEIHAQHQKLDQLKREQIQMREEFARLTAQMKEAAHHRMPIDRAEHARRAIRDTEAFLTTCGSNDEQEYYVATTHLLPKSVTQIPSALPAALDTEVCRLGEHFAENEFPDGQNENNAHAGQVPPRARLGSYSNRGMQGKGRNGGQPKQMGASLSWHSDEASRSEGTQRRGGGFTRPLHRGNTQSNRKLGDENRIEDKGHVKKIWRW